jgi:glycosyltransferase involved in cell wall biosynthesis
VADLSLSFVVPALDEAKCIGACVRAIRESAPGCQVVVVDNGSADATADAAREAGASVVVEPTRGIHAARRAGLERVLGSVVAFVDADNLVTPEWVDELLRTFADPGVVAVSGPLAYDDETPAIVTLLSSAFYSIARVLHRAWPTMQGGNYAIRRSVALASGCFDEGVEYWGEDTVTARSVARFGKIVLNPRMGIRGSSRRLRGLGTARTVWLYVVNYVWVSVVGRPLTKKYENYR